ncbi:MAG: cysteine--tRNA ligase [Verrucomicrobia bacterium]|nr:cysteine--tRNA ligase [Verrucomicrobiota bacterium]
MALRLHNTLARSVEPFVPLDPSGKHVGFYCCGPTVYDFGHIGNFRTFVCADLARRALEFCGFSVRHVMNITDVEDKIIRRVRETGKELRDYTRGYEEAFFEDLRRLSCLQPHLTPRATEYIPQIIALVSRLIERGIAYQTSDGSVYFSIERYQSDGRQYGQLVTLNFDEMRVGDRVQQDEYAKETAADFALWKARVPEDGSVFWPSPWGEGRPGWHIECSAMSMDALGSSFDLHLGGEDLMFPHHEDEIAQSEGACAHSPGVRFVKYWVHVAHLLVEGKKMSKSLGNFFTVRDLMAKGFSGREIRFELLRSHYRENFNFTFDGLAGARASLARIDECLEKLAERAGGTRATADPSVEKEFRDAIEDDLNVAAAWGVVFTWVKNLNKAMSEGGLTQQAAATALATWERIDQVFGLGRPAEVAAPDEVVKLLEARQAARKARDFKGADSLRDQIKAAGWVIEDTPQGAKLKKA